MMTRNSLITSFCAATIIAAHAISAHAQLGADRRADAPAASVNPTFEELDKTNADSALLKAKLDNARLRKELADLESGRTPNQNVVPGPSFPGPVGATQSVPQFGGGAPASAVVLLVTSSPRVNKGLPTALIRLPNGSNVSGTVGTKIPGVGTLHDVSVSQVTVQDGKGVAVIPFDAESGSR